MSSMRELSSLIVSMDEIIGKLNSFFTDSVILRMDYHIQALGSEVEGLTEFSSGELSGQAFSKICVDHAFREVLEAELKQGYFADISTSFLTRSNKPVSVSISGFYLGMISDINGYIILKVKLQEDNAFLKQELITKKRELDTFIYRAAHDLRGPLATIKGLVNLLKIRQSEKEVDELTQLIEIHANKLDDRLFKLLYLSDAHSEGENCEGVIDFSVLKGVLEKTLVDNFQLDHAIFEFISLEQSFKGINESRLAQLLNNVLLYVIGLPVATVGKEGKISIAISFEALATKLKIKIRATGFKVSAKTKEIICQPISLYNDILNYPFLFNYYVAQREAKQLSGALHVDFIEENEQTLSLTVPVNSSLAAKADKNSFPEGVPGRAGKPIQINTSQKNSNNNIL